MKPWDKPTPNLSLILGTILTLTLTVATLDDSGLKRLAPVIMGATVVILFLNNRRIKRKSAPAERD